MKNSLNNLPDGTIVYVDSNIFIYDATNHPKYAASCSIFLDRVESGEISGVTSVLSINETVHKLSVIELSTKLKKKPALILPLVKKDPSLLDDLVAPFLAAENIMNMNLEIVNLLVPMFVVVLESMKQYRLMSNDAIHVATMKKRGISDIATNDPDFERVEWLKIWKP
jgi:predicted nucleic acid-binding protein